MEDQRFVLGEHASSAILCDLINKPHEFLLRKKEAASEGGLFSLIALFPVN